MIDLKNFVLFFNGVMVTYSERNPFDPCKITFPENTYWEVLSDKDTYLILRNVQSGETKKITYGILGKVMSQKSERILILHKEKVPKVIYLGS